MRDALTKLFAAWCCIALAVGCATRVPRLAAGPPPLPAVPRAPLDYEPPTGHRVTLAWDPSPSPEVTDYRVYWGPESGRYTNYVASGGALTAQVAGLPAGRAYFAATALDGTGLESEFSEEVWADVGGAEAKVLRVIAESAPDPSGPWAFFGEVATVTNTAPGMFWRLTIAEEP